MEKSEFSNIYAAFFHKINKAVGDMASVKQGFG